ncbi:hypothetical protein [Bradyrhizobium elkanii]|uniref:hypothetical protein n=1 Tax=Bradyrhizobium elkanii TaxID=29448 RepID=UPI003D1D546B
MKLAYPMCREKVGAERRLPNILGVWWMSLAVLQSERQVQLLAKVLNDEIDLIVSHDRLLLIILLPN